jgi:hypothetical protein
MSIDKAIESDTKKVKVITQDDRKFYFDSIYYKNDKLYGSMTKKKDRIETILNEQSIDRIYLYNMKKSRTLSTLLSIGIPITIIGIMILLYVNNPPSYF